MSSLASAIFGNDKSAKENDGSSLFSTRETDASPTAPRPTAGIFLRKRPASDSTASQRPPKERVLARRKYQSELPLIKNQLTLVREKEDPEEAFAEETCSAVKLCGLAMVRDAIDGELLDQLAQEAQDCRKRVCQALLDRGLSWNENTNNHETVRFFELAVRCQGRMDVRYAYNGNDKTPFWKNHSLLNSIVSKILYGGEATELQPQLVYAGWIFSFPGSDDQPWHQDGMPLFPSNDSVVALPTYAINIFIPLDDATIETGPTEFVAFSHRQTEEKAMEQIHNNIATETESTDDAVSSKKSSSMLVNPLPRRGDMLLYDYRTCHRGTANLDPSRVRTVLYLMYARPWFREHMNFGTEQLFPEDDDDDDDKSDIDSSK